MTYRPGLVYAMLAHPQFVRRYRVDARRAVMHAGFEFLEDRAVLIDPYRQLVHLAAHRPVPYDVLFLASGTDPGWNAIAGLNVTRGGLCEDYLARHTATTLQNWRSGTLIFACGPLAANPHEPVQLGTADEFMLYESALLWDWRCRQRRVRCHTQIIVATPAPVIGEALGPRGRDRLLTILAKRDIHVTTRAHFTKVREEGIQMGQHFVPADAMVWVPPYIGSGLVRSSGLDDGYGWVPVTPYLQHRHWPEIYAVGDVTTHVPKIAHAAMVQARVAVHHWWAREHHRPLPPPYHPQVIALIDIGYGHGFFSVNTTLYGGDRDITYVGYPAQLAKHLFNRAYIWGNGWLPVMP
jgi:sulfide:quinone oxidoreductase